MRNCVIKGKRVCLGRLRKEYLDRFLNWLNDLEINRYLGPISGSLFTSEKMEEWYEHMREQNDRRIFCLYPREENTDNPIGYGGLYKLNQRNRRATIQLIIGAKEYRGKGLGTEATKLILDYGFTFLGLHSVSLSVMESNEKAINVPKKIGFKEIGRFRDYWYLNGKYIDRISMDIMRDEFYARNEARLRQRYITTE